MSERTASTGTPLLAVIIVAWNVRDLVLNCLRSLVDVARSDDVPVDIWVVDNASTDDTPRSIRQAFPDIHVDESSTNLGFAGGNNRALRALGLPSEPAYPEFVLLLNPDTIVHPGALRALVDGMTSTGAGLGGARLIYPDGSFQHSAFAFPSLMQLFIDLFPVPGRLVESRFNGRYSRVLYSGDRPFYVDHPLGATFMLRAEAIQQSGLFDEQFHLYCEEIDWALRIRQAGWRAICVPQAEIVHYGGQSTSQVRPESIVNLWTARLQLFRKHFSPIKRAFSCAIIRAGMNRLIRHTAQESSLDETTIQSLISAYREVIHRTHQL